MALGSGSHQDKESVLVYTLLSKVSKFPSIVVYDSHSTTSKLWGKKTFSFFVELDVTK